MGNYRSNALLHKNQCTYNEKNPNCFKFSNEMFSVNSNVLFDKQKQLKN